MHDSEKTNLIIPAAGRSTRFPGVKPKWMLTHPSGKLMIVSSIAGLDLRNVENIYVTVFQEHLEATGLSKGEILKAFGGIGIDEDIVNILALEAPTQNQPQTIAKTIEHFGIEGPIYIKDPDNYFTNTPRAQNSVAISDLQHSGNMNGANKSYVTVDEFGFINNIVEKKIISSTFCVGGQSFLDSQEFLRFFKATDSEGGDFYVSHIIFNMILSGAKFLMSGVDHYDDWGTLHDWNRYKKNFATMLVDLDGVLVQNSSRYFAPFWGESLPIQPNIDTLNKLHQSGKIKIIITTSRDAAYSDVTREQLKRLGIAHDDIIFGLPHSKRIIINDFAPTNPYKSCDAINLERNSSSLAHMLDGMFEEE